MRQGGAEVCGWITCFQAQLHHLLAGPTLSEFPRLNFCVCKTNTEDYY